MKKQETKLHNRLVKTDTNRVKKEIVENDLGDYLVTSKRIKIVPVDKVSRRSINDAIAVSRKLWNCCVNEIHKNPTISKEELRNKFVTKKNMPDKQIKELDWTFRIAQKVREATVSRFDANYRTAEKNLEKRNYYYKVNKKTNKKKKIKKKIVMQFREKSSDKQVIYLNKEICRFRFCEETGKTLLKISLAKDENTKKAINVEVTLQEHYVNFNTETKCNNCQMICSSTRALNDHLKIKKKCKRADNILNNGLPQAELILQRIGYDYYILVPESRTPVIKEDSPERKDIVAVDVGWNTLLTYFDPLGEWGEICPNIKNEIKSLQDDISKIKNKKSLYGRKKRKAISKRKQYIYNKIDDLHWKISHWLLSKYRKIIISRLYVARTNKTNKQTQSDLRLCQFIDRLAHVSIQYKNSEIHVCKEHNTSKACTKCLSLNTIKDKTVRCLDCKHEIHRDLNGARNIFLKHCF